MNILNKGLHEDFKNANPTIAIKDSLKGKLFSCLSDWAFYITFFAICIKTLFLTGMVMYEDNSFIVQLSSFQYLSSPLFYLCFIIALFSFSHLFRRRGHLWFLIIMNIFLSMLFLIDLWYFRVHANLLTVHLALHTLNWQAIFKNIIPVINFSDFIYLLDCAILLGIAITKKDIYKKMGRSIPLFILLFAFSIGFISFKNYEAKNNHQNLFDVLWAPGETIINLSPIGYHVFDIYDYMKECRTIELSDEKKEKIIKWFKEKEENLPDNEYKGIFKGKNLIYIQVESLENFVINKKIKEQEITPNINSLLNNSLYFSNYRDQTNHGNSSDGDLLMNTSVYPLREGGTFMLHPYTTYNSLPKLLGKSGYSTLAIKPDKPSGWNWVQSLTSIGYQKCIDISSFNVDETIGLGLSDSSYFKQLAPMMSEQKQPFFTFLVTLSSHSPYNLPEKYRELDLSSNTQMNSMGGYLESVHYTDKQIGIFLSSLKDKGLLHNTVVVISGDHCGIHKYNDYYGFSSNEHESWWDGNDKRLPFIIYSEGLIGKELKVNGGQIDALPTLAYLMGIDEKALSDTSMGRNLLKTGKDFAILSDGSCIGTFTNKTEKENALEGLNIADEIIKGDFFKQ